MRPVTDSLGGASAYDIHAMAAYVMSLQVAAPAGRTPAGLRSAPASDLVSASAPISVFAKPADRARLQTGETWFAAACASCHDPQAPMSTRGGYPPLSLGTAVNAPNARNAIQLILDGIAGGQDASGPYMPSFASMLTDAKVVDLAIYVRSRFSEQAPWAIDEKDVAKLRKEMTEP